MNPLQNPPVATPFFFYLLAATMIIGGMLVITRKNAVHSALALITTLLAQAGLYLMLYAPFVAGVQIILYAGGIMVLFLFVIMLINMERNVKERQFNKQWLVGHRRRSGAGRAVHRGLHERASDLFPKADALRRIAEYAGGCRPCCLIAHGDLYVRLRDRFAVVAGRDHRSGGDGEEEDLKEC